MARGHSVTLRPWSSRYQLAQPPVLHTVRFMRSCRSSTYAFCTSARGSALRMSPVFIRLTASTMYSACDSIMKTMLEWPRPVFGPTTKKKFGKPLTAVPL